jgi:hypothetical protein
VTEKLGKILKQVLDNLKETKGYWKLKEKQQIAVCGEHAMEEAVSCRKTDYG